ncbi:hypothetical protein [Beijerinckia sp. L45]|uniref:hypothetical protein n=1 Tax=Beijerinckia sp. L45 TaxID=1641855 RepID=UPI00131D017D|nr:hypothetical protein [Beijerinckia sp. L45]
MHTVLLLPRILPPAEPTASLDVLRDRFTMLTELGHTLADEDTFTCDELVIAALSTIDAGTVATSIAERRSLLVRGAALLITEIERIDRAAANTLTGITEMGHA